VAHDEMLFLYEIIKEKGLLLVTILIIELDNDEKKKKNG
jgi:hypothetical protein